ncbi:MAG TPA: electron transport complex subunit RsxB [Zeimonas sp.]|nr:electron transport complex subunit RsxB [Zeimonas sp.]
MTPVDAIDALLPQTQCTKCGFAGCRPYAEAIAGGEATINRCPPGGVEGIRRLAHLLGRDVLPLDPACGREQPRRAAWIDPSRCIGCTRCIQACPVDAIIGAPRRMHTVIDALCTGCDLCVAPCPVDCIAMRDAAAAGPWCDDDARAARVRHDSRRARLDRRRSEHDQRLAQRAARKLEASGSGTDGPADATALRRNAVIEAALRRARERAAAPRSTGQPPAPTADAGPSPTPGVRR